MALFFLSLLVLFSHSHTQYLLCPWHLTVIRCKFLQTSTPAKQCIYYFRLLHSNFLPPTLGLVQKIHIFPWDIMRHAAEQKTRGKSRWAGRWIGMKGRKHTEFEHAAYTWRLLFKHAYSNEPQLQTCFPFCSLFTWVPHITPTALSWDSNTLYLLLNPFLFYNFLP